MTEAENLEPPKRTSEDVLHAVARAALSAIPYGGGAAAEILSMLLGPPLERRRSKWMEDVADAIQALQEDHGVKMADLVSDEAFLDTVLHATQVALRNSQEQKRSALSNIIVNAALPGAPDDSTQLMFLHLIDIFTEWHLALLKLFHEPALHPALKDLGHREDLPSGLSTILETAFPELVGRRAFYDQIWRDLYTSGLVRTERLHSEVAGGGLLRSRTTDLGKEFIHFIEEPASAAAQPGSTGAP